MMGGKYQLFIPVDTMIMALDDDGGCDIADYAITHGKRAANRIFIDWLASRIVEQARKREIATRRGQIRAISKGGAK